MKLAIVIVAVIVAALLLSSCSYTLRSGMVVEKTYEPRRQYIMFVTMWTGKVPVMVPTWMYDDEDYIIRVRVTERNGETKNHNYYVDQYTYNRIVIGEWFNAEEVASNPSASVSVSDDDKRMGKATEEEVKKNGAIG